MQKEDFWEVSASLIEPDEKVEVDTGVNVNHLALVLAESSPIAIRCRFESGKIIGASNIASLQAAKTAGANVIAHFVSGVSDQCASTLRNMNANVISDDGYRNLFDPSPYTDASHLVVFESQLDSSSIEKIENLIGESYDLEDGLNNKYLQHEWSVKFASSVLKINVHMAPEDTRVAQSVIGMLTRMDQIAKVETYQGRYWNLMNPDLG